MRTRLRNTGALLAVATACAAVLAVPAGVGAASSTTVTYGMTGTATVVPGECPDCSSSDTASGTTTCSDCPAGKPLSGSFNLDLSTITTYPPKQCLIKSVSGTLNILWDTGQTSTVSFTGKFADHKQVLHLDGTFDVSSLTQWAYHQAGISLNDYPRDRCQPVTSGITAAMTITG